MIPQTKPDATNKKSRRTRDLSSVPKLGVEPRRLYSHYALNVARLPIPPLRQGESDFTLFKLFVNAALPINPLIAIIFAVYLIM